ncbi:MAG: hypothetical protein U0525_05440 [Patescibacteria group bacterium]
MMTALTEAFNSNRKLETIRQLFRDSFRHTVCQITQRYATGSTIPSELGMPETGTTRHFLDTIRGKDNVDVIGDIKEANIMYSYRHRPLVAESILAVGYDLATRPFREYLLRGEGTLFCRLPNRIQNSIVRGVYRPYQPMLDHWGGEHGGGMGGDRHDSSW